MRWFRLYNDLPDHPKWLALTPTQRAFLIEVLCIAAREDEAGAVPLLGLGARLRHPPKDTTECLAALVREGWVVREETERGSSVVRVRSWEARQSPDDTGKLRQRKRRERLTSAPKCHAPVTEPSRDCHALDPDPDPDPEGDLNTPTVCTPHATESTGETPDPPDLDEDEREELRLDAEDTRPRKKNPLYESALSVAALHAAVFSLPGKPTAEALKPLLRCLGRRVGMTPWHCRLVVYATWADEYACERGWTTLKHAFGDPERARQRASEGEEARRAWFCARAKTQYEAEGRHPHDGEIQARAQIMLDMEADTFGANGRPREQGAG